MIIKKNAETCLTNNYLNYPLVNQTIHIKLENIVKGFSYIKDIKLNGFYSHNDLRNKLAFYEPVSTDNLG